MHRKQRYPIEYKIITKRHSNNTQGVLNRFNEEFEKNATYLSILSEKLTLFDKMSSRINKERTDYVIELNNYHPIFSSWSQTEPEFADLLKMIGKALECSASAQNGLIPSNGNNLISNPIKDLISYIDVVQETIKKRESYQYVYESSLDELNKRHAEKDKVSNLNLF